MDRYQALRAGEPPKYVGRCRNIPRDEARRRVENGEPAVVRFRVPDGEREIAFTDLVRGRVSFSSEVIGDFVLLRSDGVPAYNFAVVVDDALMEITHVIRGEDHISNTPRQLLLYEAFGWTPPALRARVDGARAPIIRSCRSVHGATSVSEFREQGYLPEALANYLALLGWSPGEGEELLPLDELARRFRIEDVGKSAGVFDPEKLAWANRHYLKAAAPDRLAAHLRYRSCSRQGWVSTPTMPALEFLAHAVPVAAASVDRLDQVPARLRFLFDYSAARALEDPAVRAEAEAARGVIAALAEELASSGPLTDRDAFRAAAARVRERTGAKGKALFHPIRLALTGEPEGVELDLAVPLDRARGVADANPGGGPPSGASHRRARAGRRISARARAGHGLEGVIIYGINPVLEALRAGRVKEVRVSRATPPSAATSGCASCWRWPRSAASACGACRSTCSSANRGAAFTRASSPTSRKATTTASTSSCAARPARR